MAAFAKNYLTIGFKLDYIRADGNLPNYFPDFVARTGDGTVWVVETKGRVELDLPAKMARLAQWCESATQANEAEGGPEYRFVYLDEAGFEKMQPKSFASLVSGFREYQTA